MLTGWYFGLAKADDRGRPAILLHVVRTDKKGGHGTSRAVVHSKDIPVPNNQISKLSRWKVKKLTDLSVTEVSHMTLVTFSGRSLMAVNSSLIGLKM